MTTKIDIDANADLKDITAEPGGDAATDRAAKPEADKAAADVRQIRERLDRVNGALVMSARQRQR